MKSLLCIHPGETLYEDFMQPYGLTVAQVASDIGASTTEIREIVNGKRAITADMALRLAKYFDTSAKIWLRLQARYDLEMAEQRFGQKIENEVKVLIIPQSPVMASTLATTPH